MTLLAVARYAALWAVMNAQPAEAPEPGAWRLVTTPTVHIGLRPAASWGEGAGLTLQVSAKTPW